MASNGNQEDRLSSLPDPLLVHILSFLPTTQAVKTMLIKPFGNLWTSLPNLDLDDSFFHICDDDDDDEDEDEDDDDEHSLLDLQMFRFARNLLMRHSNPKIHKFSVNISEISPFEIEDGNIRPDIDSWINCALRKQVEVLDFSVGWVVGEEVLYKLPHSMFISHSLIDLKLTFVEMNIQRRVQMRSLRILRLSSVKISDEVFREIISGCPFLMELEICDCWGFNELSVDAPNLELLKIYVDEDDIIRINCPNVRSFDFSGSVDFVEIVNLSSLLDLTFYLTYGIMMDFQVVPQFIAVLEKVLHAKVVSLSYAFVTVLFYCMLKDIPQLLFGWERVELSILLTDRHIPGLYHLLSYSTCLEKLVLHLRSPHLTVIEPIESKLNSYIPDEEGGWRCLKSIAIHDISKSSYDVLLRLVELLLKKALVLDELVIYYHRRSSEFTSGELEGFAARVSTFSKASQHAKVSLLRSREETSLSDF